MQNLVRPTRAVVAGVCGFFVATGTVACGDDATDPSTGTGGVSGIVTASPAGGVAGVVVTLSRSGFASVSATSTANGSFAFAEVSPGPWSLSV